MIRFLVPSILLAVFMGPACAEVAHADLVCDAAHNIALARFQEDSDEGQPHYTVLPANIDSGLSAQNGTGHRVCKLANGWEVKLRNGEGQAFPYGQGGAAPGAFFSLWVDRHKIFSKKYWTDHDYAADLTPIAGVVIKPQGITICEIRNGKPACTAQKLSLKTHPVDAIEYPAIPAPAAAPGELMVVGGTGQKNLCPHLVTHGSSGFDYASEPDIKIAAATWDWIDTEKLKNPDPWADVGDIQNVFGIALDYANGRFSFPSYPGDFDGDDKPDTVLAFGGNNHYFDGDIYIVAPSSISLRTMLETLVAQDKDMDIEKSIETAKAQGWHVYAGGGAGLYPNVSPRYVHLDRIDYIGTRLLLAQPTNLDEYPTAMAIKPRADGSFETVCVFQRPRLNY